jgi:SAM-dependent methyltransferase
MSYTYDNDFFDFVNASSGKSAALFLNRLTQSVLRDALPKSVLDVGCGRGVWLAAWLRYPGVVVTGLDGDYVDRKSLLIPPERFTATDIAQPVDLGQRFDLVECLEVAEHIPRERADVLIDTLVRHGDLILFSAATPGQGGEFHVNEQPHDYWREKFSRRGYSTYDAIRPLVAGTSEIEPWYRYNAFVFANAAGQQRLSADAQETLIPDDAPAPTVAPVLWRLRCMAIAALPSSAASDLARLKHRMANRWNRATTRT